MVFVFFFNCYICCPLCVILCLFLLQYVNFLSVGLLTIQAIQLLSSRCQSKHIVEVQKGVS